MPSAFRWPLKKKEEKGGGKKGRLCLLLSLTSLRQGRDCAVPLVRQAQRREEKKEEKREGGEGGGGGTYTWRTASLSSPVYQRWSSLVANGP